MTVVTVEGRVGGDPDLRFISTGKAVASFSIVSDRRRKNPTTDEWESTETTGRKDTAGGAPGENSTSASRKTVRPASVLSSRRTTSAPP